MEDLKTILAIAGGIILVVTTLLGLGRSYLKNQELIERAKILDENRELSARLRDNEKAHEEEKRTLSARLDVCELQREELDERISLIGRAGGAALALKSTLDAELRGLMRSFQASGGSIYVPVRGPRGNVRGLAFLCIEPFTRENQRLKSQIIPLRSHAGRCFTTGEPRAVANVDESGDHYEEADAIANYRPSSTLEVALRQDGDIIGVLQLLREKGEPSFLETHVPKVATLAHDLAKRVFEATRDIDSAKLLGLAVEDFAVEGTVMVFDLSRSARLFEELASSHALLLLNEFFEEMCQLAFAAGGTVDTYMGDGALLRFNVPKALADHELAAIRTAIEMGDAFTRLRTERWLSYGPEFADMHLRVGIATGPLIRANLGHSQVQHLTVLGHPISVAAALCDSASRDRNVILASEETVAAIRGRVICHAPDAADLAKALSFTPAAHEIEGIRAG